MCSTENLHILAFVFTRVEARSRLTDMLGLALRAQAVPTVCLGLLQHLEAMDTRLTHLRMVCVGGSACPPSMIQARACPE